MTEAIVRVGIPQPGGQLVAAARRRRLPVLFSANAFARTYGKQHERAGYFRSFRMPDPQQFEGLDAALDSAGFVAAAHYGDYRWTVDEYLDLVAAHPWTWWSSLDFCCEPGVASDRPLRLLRMAATVRLYAECSRGARERGLPAPMPILQGWTPQEYVTSVEWLALLEWPDLVGVGSVCRRPVDGPDGLLAVLEAIDAVLSPRVRLHLFGVKSSALDIIGGHPRIASVDSMAWDMAARVERRTGRTMDVRIRHLQAWSAAQRAVSHKAAARSQARIGWGGRVESEADQARQSLTDSRPAAVRKRLLQEALAMRYAELVMGGDLEYRDAVWHCVRYGATADALLDAHAHRWSRALGAQLDEVIDGLGEGFKGMCEGASS